MSWDLGGGAGHMREQQQVGSDDRPVGSWPIACSYVPAGCKDVPMRRERSPFD